LQLIFLDGIGPLIILNVKHFLNQSIYKFNIKFIRIRFSNLGTLIWFIKFRLIKLLLDIVDGRKRFEGLKADRSTLFTGL
jgi:hypothetical protein